MAASHNYPQYPTSSPYYEPSDVSSVDPSNPMLQSSSPPPPPAHRSPVGMHPDSAYGNMQGRPQHGNPNNYSDYTPPGITPGTDNLGESAAGGGINGIAIGVANANERESGLQALRDIDNWGRNGNNLAGPYNAPQDRNYQGNASFDDHHYGYDQPAPPRPVHSQSSFNSNAPLSASAAMPHAAGNTSPITGSSERSLPLSHRPSPSQNYQDTPYNRYSSSTLQHMGAINPNEADDDDDWGMGPQQPNQPKRRSFVPFGNSRDQSREGTPGSSVAALGAGVGAGAAAGTFAATRDPSGQYNAVPGGSGGSANGSSNMEAQTGEKSEWLASQNHGSKKLKWIVGTIIVLVIIGAVVGGVLGALLNKNKGGGGGGSGSSETPQTVADDNKKDLTADSAEIKQLMSNTALHKVFPGIDYTPLNAQYPECLHVGPSQNNITRDIAVMSRLTNAVRLYGTDCNQTEMVLEAITRLKLENEMKIWLGVWLGNNETTNDRQISQMWDLIDHHQEIDGNKKAIQNKFKGIIVGNEVLYREDLTEQELMHIIGDIKTNLTKHEINLPIATSDLGDNWNSQMANSGNISIVMSNVHPFFAGVTVDKAAGWTWDFWNNHDVILTKGNDDVKQIVAEVGWPSGGGNNCGSGTCTTTSEGSVAGVEELNQFLEDWVCPSMNNGTEYFWFSAFDEPWKIRYNTKGKEWEDKWGLMDVNRKLKDGVKIPDCGGKTVS
ncbi:glycoside hydrolase family 17 protein [Aaosphaeria arxii CBS 175.79]|uniref:glucan endo-1,3-beta-D-glucosidase n=1 Tax=Aaosphaeria arxii CBS 175.79 TaxID=1450172 RepID=A0A6A5Y2M6_9PLEO|nr:glycoside hydrolase family 17 protein [Aaosphaeria arxii CBS 175.79]KAF2019815.1 glycoside hydrolase family 17 protein [Aaosphaeria arxii CBS 175.79]